MHVLVLTNEKQLLLRSRRSRSRLDGVVTMPQSWTNIRIDSHFSNSKVMEVFLFTGNLSLLTTYQTLYRGADKSLAQPGRKQANVSVRMA